MSRLIAFALLSFPLLEKVANMDRTPLVSYRNLKLVRDGSDITYNLIAILTINSLKQLKNGPGLAPFNISGQTEKKRLRKRVNNKNVAWLDVCKCNYFIYLM